jgi:hypothetical protein
MNVLTNLVNQYNKKRIQFSTTVTKISLREQIPKCSLLTSSSFVPQHIREYIDKESKVYSTHEYEYKGRKFVIIMVSENGHVERKKGIVEKMFKWLSIIVDHGELSPNCGHVTTVYCYLTPFKKELPAKRGEFLSYDNANSAVTTACSSSNEICIFREEEMFKVFIHETFHAFNLDFSLHMDKLDLSKIKKMFHIKSEFNLYEAYAEFWAELMNVVFAGGNKALQAEIDFSLHQLNKVLAYMGLSYRELIDRKGYSRYKEETNVFCYYVLKTVLLYYWSDFLKRWPSFKFKPTKHNLAEFVKFIGEKHDTPEFLEAVETAGKEPFLSNTMRMTVNGEN